ncbi:MAG: DNA alkylation repair protein [Verrucomicrobiota bacterium]|jgi:3-methyladenine DNA glycosylase AlkD|nr:DNA alkylation repair protein [Verrucomicrobiota bacterium]
MKPATAKQVLAELARRKDAEQAHHLRRFFKTGPGQYGEGDVFWGLRVPQTRSVLTLFPDVPLSVAEELLHSPVHEVRLFAVLAMAREYRRTDAGGREAVFSSYLAHARRINNWDLVDLSAPNVVGRHLPPGKGRNVLKALVRSDCLWERRMAMVATLAHIRQDDFHNTFWLAELLLNDPHDLMHKATGWMLREVGKRDADALRLFLDQNAVRLPRTALRYAIERFDSAERRQWRLRR